MSSPERMRRLSLLIACLLAVTAPLAGCLTDTGSDGGSAGPTADGTSDGRDAEAASAPHWRFTDTNGTEQSAESTAGAPRVLFFMATWCSSCKSKAPVVRDVAGDYEAQGVRVLSVGVDPTESDAELEAWKDEYAQDWPHGVDADGSVQRTFGIRYQSSLVVLDADGHEVAKWQYPGASEDELRAAVDEALARSA